MAKDLTSKDSLPTANDELTETIKTVLAENMGGLTFFANGFKRGYGNSIFGSDVNGIWLGAADFANGLIRFGLDGSGYIGGNVIIGGNVTIQGYLQVGAAAADVNNGSTTISGSKLTVGTVVADTVRSSWVYAGNISANQINTGTLNASLITVTNLSADVITVGTLNVDRIASGAITGGKIANSTITYDKLSVSSLSAISANLGTITGGQIYIGDASSLVFMLSSSGVGVVGFYAGGNLTGLMRGTTAGSGGIAIVDGDLVLSNNRSLLITSSGGGSSEYGGVGITNGNQFWLTLGTNNTLYVKNNAQNDNYFTVSSSTVFCNNGLQVNGQMRCKSIALDYDQNEGSISKIDWLEGYNDLNLKCQGQNKIFFDSSTNDSGNDDLSMYPHWGDFYATGTKYFRIPHPDHPKDGWIQYTSVESPEVCLRIRGKAKLNKGSILIKLPRHWKLVTENINVTVVITPLDDCNGLFVVKSLLSNEQFTIKESKNGVSNSEFMWEMSAVRKGYSNFNPEQTLEDDAQRELSRIIDFENNPEKYSILRNEKFDRYNKIKMLLRQKYETLTKKTLINGGDERLQLNKNVIIK